MANSATFWIIIALLVFIACTILVFSCLNSMRADFSELERLHRLLDRRVTKLEISRGKTEG